MGGGQTLGRQVGPGPARPQASIWEKRPKMAKNRKFSKSLFRPKNTQKVDILHQKGVLSMFSMFLGKVENGQKMDFFQ